MARDDVKYEKAKAFAVRIMKLYRFLQNERHERVLSNQIMRSGTSVAANIGEAIYAYSTADFLNKLSISRKEASETRVWIDLLEEGEYITTLQAESLRSDCIEIIKILSSVILTTRDKYLKSKKK